MRLPLFLHRWIHRAGLSRRRLRGSWLHSWLGDRLLARELWKPTRESLARGWLVGFPITMVPFLPVQSLFASMAALLVRGNLLVCIALQFLSTPLTAPLQLSACYFVGAVMLGEPPAATWQRISQDPKQLLGSKALGRLYLGATTLGVAGGAIGYFTIQATWRQPSRPSRRPVRSAHTDWNER